MSVSIVTYYCMSKIECKIFGGIHICSGKKKQIGQQHSANFVVFGKLQSFQILQMSPAGRMPIPCNATIKTHNILKL